MTRRITAIMNPISGARNRRAELDEIGRRLQAHGAHFDLQFTTQPNHAAALAAAAVEISDAILVVGGDGTVREVAEGMIGSTTPLLIFPTGTENLVARQFGMTTDIDRVVECLLNGTTISCDLWRANGKAMLVVAGIGFDAECAYRLSQNRRGHITYFSWVRASLKAFWSYRFPTIRVELDGQCVFDDKGLAFVGNLPCYGGGLNILAKAKYDDGLLDVCVLPCQSRLNLARQAWRIFRSRHVDSPGAYYGQGSRVSITSTDSVRVQIDGDEGGFLPLDITHIPGGVRFITIRKENL